MDRRSLLNDPEETMRLVLDGRQSTIWTALPCIVTSVNLNKMTLEAQPAIQGSTYDENGNAAAVNLPLLVNVPVVFPSAGGFTITFPITSGDEVLIVFSSRCIDAWWQSGGVQRPIEMRMHDLSDGFAIPGPRSQTRLVPSISTTGCQIRNDSGSAYIEIAADGKIKLVSPVEIDITTPTLKVSGAIVATGEITGNNIALSTHHHSGVTPGGGITGGPIP